MISIKIALCRPLLRCLGVTICSPTKALLGKAASQIQIKQHISLLNIFNRHINAVMTIYGLNKLKVIPG